MRAILLLLPIAGCNVMSAIHHAGWADCEIYDIGTDLGFDCEEAELCWNTDDESMFFDEQGRRYDIDNSVQDGLDYLCRWCNFSSTDERSYFCD